MKKCLILRPDPYLLLLNILLNITLFSLQNVNAFCTGYSHIDKLIQDRLSEAPFQVTVRGQRLHAIALLNDYYKKRGYLPVWIGADGSLKQVDNLVSVIKKADREGLTPDNYHLQTIKTLLGEMNKQEVLYNTLADLEILLTDAFFLLGCHYSAGCVNPVTIEAECFASPVELDITSVFEKSLKENRIEESLQSLLPQQNIYENLRKYLNLYRELNERGGWSMIEKGYPLKKGMRDCRVIDLKKRLLLTGHLPFGKSTSGELFDEPLEKAVLLFQRHHGLEPDGVVGFRTLKALNVPAEVRARQIELNLERLRWVSRNLGSRYIKVNIADFTLKVIERDRTVLSMKVVVGKPFWHTPVFSDKMTYLVLNPSWNVPRSIALTEILPKVQKDIDYLKKQNIKILKGWEDAEEIDPETIDWASMDADTFKYRFRQEPGPMNPLGRIKFIFPNQFGVYLHDTPSKGLFARSVRIFSHGCIRLQKPFELAEYFLRKDPRWTRERILEEIKLGKTKEIRLPDPIDVHILYLTAFVDEEGFLHFRDDIYGRDKRLDEAMRKQTPVTKLDSLPFLGYHVRN